MNEITIKKEHMVLLKNLKVNSETFPKIILNFEKFLVSKKVKELFKREDINFTSFSSKDLSNLYKEVAIVLEIAIEHQTWNLEGKTYAKDSGKWGKKNIFDCRGLPFGEVVETMRKGFELNPHWCLDFYFCQSIFKLEDDAIIKRALGQLEGEGCIEKKLHVVCPNCDGGLEFVDPTESPITITCDICYNHPVGRVEGEVWKPIK